MIEEVGQPRRKDGLRVCNRYLFGPYSVFTVTAVAWSADVQRTHLLSIEAVHDSAKESDELPLAPWY